LLYPRKKLFKVHVLYIPKNEYLRIVQLRIFRSTKEDEIFIDTKGELILSSVNILITKETMEKLPNK